MIRHGVWLCFFLLLLGGCRRDKVPLRYSPPFLEIVASHWFENEKVFYLFFRVRGIPKDEINELLSFQLTDSLSKPDFLTKGDTGFKTLNPMDSVHTHTLEACGDSICGSYSVLTPQAPASVHLRLRYHRESSLVTELVSHPTAHRDRGTGTSFSRLIYGVFDSTNEHVQIQSVPNFGYPSGNAITQFGLHQKIQIQKIIPTQWTGEDLKLLRQASQTPTLLSQLPCSIENFKEPPPDLSGPWTLDDGKGWLEQNLNVAPFFSGLCFQVVFLDQHKKPLTQAFGIARRNPELASYPISLQTPLNSAVSIPILLSYCTSTNDTKPMDSDLFLQYQKFILGAPTEPLDACFKIGQEESFRHQLQGILGHKLQKYREKSDPHQKRDFIFSVILNHRLSSEFQSFQSLVAHELQRYLKAESQSGSPRLVGAFVYDSNAYFDRTTLFQQNILWCPQAPNLNLKSDSDSDSDSKPVAFDGGVNCAVTESREIKSTLLNFLIPMGPFPSLNTYEDYHRLYGDKGFIKNPRLEFHSVLVDPLTIHDGDARVTFFESQTLTVQPQEGLRICYENDIEDSKLPHLRFLKLDSKTEIVELGQLLSRLSEEILPAEFRVGISWEYSFFGGVRFDLPLSGSILGLIPFEKNVSSESAMGDPKWLRSIWNLEPLFQKCERHCDHPFFDEAGVYQLQQAWKDPKALHCIHAKTPVRGDVL